MTTRKKIVAHIEDAFGPLDPDADDEDQIILFDGMEDAFVGIAERFEPDGHHRTFAVYSYERMVAVLAVSMSDDEAREYLEYNTVGAYVGPTTPAILRTERLTE